MLIAYVVIGVAMQVQDCPGALRAVSFGRSDSVAATQAASCGQRGRDAVAKALRDHGRSRPDLVGAALSIHVEHLPLFDAALDILSDRTAAPRGRASAIRVAARQAFGPGAMLARTKEGCRLLIRPALVNERPTDPLQETDRARFRWALVALTRTKGEPHELQEVAACALQRWQSLRRTVSTSMIEIAPVCRWRFAISSALAAHATLKWWDSEGHSGYIGVERGTQQLDVPGSGNVSFSGGEDTIRVKASSALCR